MTLNYDFDMFDVIPSDLSDDPELRRFLSRAGFDKAPETGKIALFRDVRTAEALRAAGESVTAYFLESGFGLNTYESGAPYGRYPAKDEEARLEVIGRLAENARHYELIEAREGTEEFCLSDFLDQLARSSPIEVSAPEGQAVDAISEPVPKNRPFARMTQGGGNLATLASRVLLAVPRFAQLRRGSAAS